MTLCTPNCLLLSPPEELLHLVCQWLPITTLASLSQTCKRFLFVCRIGVKLKNRLKYKLKDTDLLQGRPYDSNCRAKVEGIVKWRSVTFSLKLALRCLSDRVHVFRMLHCLDKSEADHVKVSLFLGSSISRADLYVALQYHLHELILRSCYWLRYEHHQKLLKLRATEARRVCRRRKTH